MLVRRGSGKLTRNAGKKRQLPSRQAVATAVCYLQPAGWRLPRQLAVCRHLPDMLIRSVSVAIAALEGLIATRGAAGSHHAARTGMTCMNPTALDSIAIKAVLRKPFLDLQTSAGLRAASEGVCSILSRHTCCRPKSTG